MNKKKHLFIAGYYGFDNLGDEAVLEAMLADLQRFEPSLEFIVASETPEATATAYRVRSVSWRDAESVLRSVEESDAILLGGGGTISISGRYDSNLLLIEGHQNFSYFKFGLPLMAHLAGKPFMIYAGGAHLGTPRAAWEHIRVSVGIADIVTIRDVTSKSILGSFGCEVSKAQVTADAAFSLEPASGTRVKEVLAQEGVTLRDPTIVVAIRNRMENDPVPWDREIVCALQAFAEAHDALILFIAFSKRRNLHENDDLSIIDKVRAHLGTSAKSAVLRGNLSPSEIAGVIASCDLVLSMRYHSLVLAVNGHVPCVSLVYDYNDPKIIDLMKRLRLEEFQLDLVSVSSEKLLSALERAYQQRHQIQTQLTRTHAKLTKQAWVNARLAVRLIKKRRKSPSRTTAPFLQKVILQKFKQLFQMQKQTKVFLSALRELVNNQELATAARFLERLPEENWYYPDPEWNYLVAFCLHVQMRDLEKALRCYNLALKHGFDEFWVRYNRGALYAELGDVEQARSDLKRAVALNPDHEGARQVLQQLKGVVVSNGH